MPVNKYVGGTRLPKHFVASAFIVDSGRVLLVKHRKLKLWLPPGGHIDPDEDPIAAVQREVREETGLEVELPSSPDMKKGSTDTVEVISSPHHIQIELIPQGPHLHIDLVYFCRRVSGESKMNEESTDMRWFTPKDLESPELDPNVRYFATQALSMMGEHRDASPRTRKG